jgi:hypothetical protein
VSRSKQSTRQGMQVCAESEPGSESHRTFCGADLVRVPRTAALPSDSDSAHLVGFGPRGFRWVADLQIWRQETAPTEPHDHLQSRPGW